MVIKIGLESIPPFLGVGLRFLLASGIFLIYVRIKKYSIPMDFESQKFFLSFGMIIFTGGYALVYWGEQYINLAPGWVRPTLPFRDGQT